MRETLFVIPHFFFEGPLFWGWLMLGGILLGWLAFKGEGKWLEFLPFYLVVAALIKFVLPEVEFKGINPVDPNGPLIPLGIAVRGYGFFMLLGMVSGIGLVCWRAQRFGINIDQVLSLTFTMVICGIIGARAFYVIQKYENFENDSLIDFLRHALDMTEGGLVVYGSLIGGSLGASFYLWRTRLPALLLADLLAPSMVLGLALGRLGCLMNGCCFGGVCDAPNLPAIQFPPGSPPYMAQLGTGELLGLELERIEHQVFLFQVKSVAPNSVAAKANVQVDDLLNFQYPNALVLQRLDDLSPEQMNEELNQEFARQNQVLLQIQRKGDELPRAAVQVPVADLPPNSKRVHPTQIYSSVNAFLMCLFLWFYFPYRRGDGEVFAVMLMVYSVARYLLETIRNDESGQFGTEYTISQWVSFAVIVAGIGLFVYSRFYRNFPKRPETAQPAPG